MIRKLSKISFLFLRIFIQIKTFFNVHILTKLFHPLNYN